MLNSTDDGVPRTKAEPVACYPYMSESAKKLFRMSWQIVQLGLLRGPKHSKIFALQWAIKNLKAVAGTLLDSNLSHHGLRIYTFSLETVPLKQKQISNGNYSTKENEKHLFYFSHRFPCRILR